MTISLFELSNLTVSILGVAIAGGGFYAVLKQLRLNHMALESKNRALVYELSNSIYKTFVDNPKLRPYFYEKKVLSEYDEDRNMVLAASELLMDFFENTFTGRQALGEELTNTWICYARALFNNSPALQEFMEMSGTQYNNDFRKTIKAPVIDNVSQKN